MSTAGTQLHNTVGPQVGGRMQTGQATDLEFDVDAMIDAINKPTRETDRTRLKDGRLQGHKLIGFGEEKETCGDPFHLFCECCGSTTPTADVCAQSACPRCASEWVRRTATRQASRLWALKLYRNAIESNQNHLHHVVLSPADYLAGETDDKEKDWWLKADDPLERSKEVVKELLDEMYAAGLIVYHEYRARDKDDPFDVEDSRGVWKELIFEGYDWDDVSPNGPSPEGIPQVKRAPHFHAIVVSPEIPGPGVTDVIYEETHWIIHRITDNRGYSIDGMEDLAATLAYCLSHTVIIDGEKRNETATWWFGEYFGGVHQVTASDELETRMDLVVRLVAPRVLDLDYSMLICPVDRPEKLLEDDPYEHLTLENVMGRLKKKGGRHYEWDSDGHDHDHDGDGGGSGAGGDPPTSSASVDSWDQGMVLNPPRQLDEFNDISEQDLRALVETGRETRCTGRLLSIAKAKPYLDDERWCQNAKYADETRETYHEYADDPDHWVDSN